MIVFLYPYGGLANRMRAIDSAVNYCALKNKLVVVWNKERGMNCKWSDVFYPVPFIKDKASNKLIRFVFKQSGDISIVKKKAFSFLKQMHILCVLDLFDGSKYEEYYRDLSRRYLIMLIKSCLDFCPKEEFHNELFVIKDQSKLKRELKKVGENTIGVHVRRTDHKIAIENSPLELFEQKMSMEQERCPETTFYLCSDDNSVKEKLQAKFGEDMVAVPDGVIDRESVEGIVQAACEMQALAHCRRIYGSYGSSFGTVAARLGNIEVIRLSK